MSLEAIVFVVAAASQMTFPVPGAADAAPPALGVVGKVCDGMKDVAAKFGVADAAPPAFDDRGTKFVDGRKGAGAIFGVGSNGVDAEVAATCTAFVAFVDWAGLGWLWLH